MENQPISKILKTPSPPAKIKQLILETVDFDRKISTSGGGYTSNSDNSINNDQYQRSFNYQFNCLHTNQPINNQLNLQSNQQINNNHQLLTKTNDSILQPVGLKTEDFNSKASIKPLSNESQNKPGLACRSRLSNTGDALTGVWKKYRELQARSTKSLVLDNSTDEEEEEESNHNTVDISITPSFKYSSDEEEVEKDFSSSQRTNSLESAGNDKKQVNKNLRPYKSEPQLSSFEDSGDQSLNSGMYQDSIRYHSHNALKKSAKAFETVTVCGVDYFVLNLIGEGGSSKVYQVCDYQKNEFYALKVVDMSKMVDSLKCSLKKEIEILKMLKGCKRVIQLYAYEENKEEDKLMLVMEKGDSDLNTVLHKQIQNETKKRGLDLHTIKHYWNEMLKAVDEIHKKGIVHSDLKPVNFVIVKGYLKIIDFGIADTINPDHTSVIKSNLIGTINYMSPESLMGRPNTQFTNGKKLIKVNCKSDVWSLGCILYNMIYGKTPFGHIEQIYEKISAICSNKSEIKFPPYENKDAVDCITKCLLRNPDKRPTVKDLFEHPFLKGEKTASRLQAPTQTRIINFRNPLIERQRLFDEIGSEVNNLTPRSLAKFKNVMKKELIKMKK